MSPPNDLAFWKARLGGAARCVCDSAKLMVGLPNYDAYLSHMAKTHPDQPPMTYEAFFRNRQDARYGGGKTGGFRCC